VSRNPCLDAALRELAAAGIRDVIQSHGGKHLQLRWTVNGHSERMYSMALTPSDVRAPQNVRAAIRRMLREDGILIEPLKANVPAPPKASHRIASLEGRVAALEQKLKALQSELHDNS
jgi:hypothetical protein